MRLDRPTTNAQRGYISTLDGWRAVAVMLVIGSHSLPMLENNGTRPALLLKDFFVHSGYGVDIFFALSGFLISNLLLREKEYANGISLTRFYVRRAFRIIPPLVIYLSVYFILIEFHLINAEPGHEVIGSLLFARNYVYGSWYTGHFWSLSIEEHFYAIIPCMIIIFSPRALLKISLFFVIICICVREFEFSHALWFQPLPQFRTENRVDALLWGSIIAQLCRKPAFIAWLKAALPGIRLMILIIFSGIALTVIESQAVRRSIFAFILPLIICYTAVLRPNSIISHILENPILKFIGRISYSLYIWQMMFLVPGIRPLGVLQAFPLNFIVPIVLAYGSFRWIESPMIRFGHRIAGAGKAAAYGSIPNISKVWSD